MIGGRDHVVVVEVEGLEGLHRVEEEVLGLHLFATSERPETLRLRQERPSARVADVLDERGDALIVAGVVDAPSRGATAIDGPQTVLSMMPVGAPALRAA